MSRERIAHAALRIIDEEGPDSLSMRRIAALLDVQAMSLYNHVRGKADVLALVTDAVAADMALPERLEGDWADGVREIARAFRKAALAHPRACELVLTRQLGSPAALRAVDMVLGLLLEAGFDEDVAVHALRLFTAYATGALLGEARAAGEYHGASGDGDVRQLAGCGLPAVSRVAPRLADVDHEAEYAFGLERLIDSLRAYAPPAPA
ncbi:TetR family transcriptional regulator [Streptomyces sp. GC420]|nr:TetR family transcriptional regulator [Streptomyces sp. GC420]